MPKRQLATPASPDPHFGFRYDAASITSPVASTAPTNIDDPSMLRSKLALIPASEEISYQYQAKQSKAQKQSKCCKLTPGGVWSSIFNMCATAIGCGVLSLPYAIKLNGIIPGIIAMFVAAAGSIWSMRLIVACSNAAECRSFGKITQIGGGRCLSLTLDIMILIYTTGVSITFIAISKLASLLDKDLIKTMLEAFHYQPSVLVLDIIMCCISAFILFPLSLIRHFTSLRFSTLLSVTAIGVLILAILIKTPWFAHDALQREKPLLFEYKFSLFQVIGMMFFSFTCHLNLLPVYSELRNPLTRRINRVIVRSILIDLLFYLLISLTGYFSFLSLSGKLITENGGDDVFYIIARIIVILPVTIGVPVNFISFKASLAVLIQKCDKSRKKNDRLLDGSLVSSNATPQLDSHSKQDVSQKVPTLTDKQNSISAVIFVIFITTVALLYSDITSFLGILGGIFSVGMCFLIPMILYLILAPHPFCSFEKIGSLIVGIIISVLGLLSVAASIQSIINGT